MPLFARRRLQAMIDDLAPRLNQSKVRDFVGRLENKRVDQVLPAELELALLWGLDRLGDVEVEPEWYGTTRLPDAYSEALFPGHRTIIEIAAISDASLGHENEMRMVAFRICEAANRHRRGSGKFLYIQFGYESGFVRGKFLRRRKVSSKFALRDEDASRLVKWLDLPKGSKRKPLHIQNGKTDLVVHWRDQEQSRLFNFYSPMPPEVYDLTDNPIHSTLESKSEQLENEGFDGIRCLLLADSGSRLIDRALQSPDTYSDEEIIQSYIEVSNCRLDVIALFSPVRQQVQLGRRETELVWSLDKYARPGVDINLNRLDLLAAKLPRPRFEARQARALQLQGAYSFTRNRWYLGALIRRNEQKMTIKISSRALLDLLAGHITYEQFCKKIGMYESDGRSNYFKLCLERGNVFSNVRFSPGGLDEDDDEIQFEFEIDPSASKLLDSGREKNTPNDPPGQGEES